MIPVEFGEIGHPWHDGAGMTEAPMIHPSCLVRNSRMGPWTVLGPRTQLLDSEFRDYAYTARDVDIYNADVGKFCNIAAAVRINPANHPMERASQHHFTYRSRSHHLGAADDPAVFAWRRAHRVTIGPDVWIGHGAILMPGVAVGTGAVIGAGAVVTQDVAPYTLAVGVPARALRRRFSAAIERALIRIAWWDWEKERLAAALEDFRRLGVEDFVRKYDRAA
jgi:phosphonate metabolism protein (transferase hexapeptide repeat family)